MQIQLDSNTICVQAKGLTKQDVEDVIAGWMTYAPKGVTCDTSLACNAEDVFLGFGYVRFSHPSMYHMILGRKPDGSKNVRYYEDPTFVPKSTMNYDIDPFKTPMKLDWAAEVEACIAPMLEEILPPLIPIEPYKEVKVLVSPAAVCDTEHSNIMIAKFVPAWVTVDMLFEICSPFSNYKGYPRIDIRREKQEARLVFQPDSYNANFAAFVLHRKTITKGKNTATILFRLFKNKH